MIEKLLAFLQSLFLLPILGEAFSQSEKSAKEAEITPENAIKIFNDLLAEQNANKEIQSRSVAHINPTHRTEPIFTNTEQPQPTNLLKKLAPLRSLPESMLVQLEQKTFHYAAESVVFIAAQNTEYAYYLLQGSVEMRPAGVLPYQVHSDTPQALMPLNTGYLFGATAVTIVPSIILAVSRAFLLRLSRQKYRYTAGNEFVKSGLPRKLPNNQFFNAFATAYKDNSLTIPSLPQTAQRLKQAMENPNVTIADVVNIVQHDAASAKLIKVANSAFYAGEATVTNCQNAVLRLGLDGTRRVVMGLSVKQLFQCQNPQLKNLMDANWRNSIHLASLCFILAKESRTISPEDAMLAGLVCDIGKVPVLNFAEQLTVPPSILELKTAMPFLSPAVGTFVLYNLHFPAEIVNIPKFSEDWFYESGEEKLTLTDIVILAKLHSYFGSKKAKYQPFLNTIPAYVKLHEKHLSGDFSLNVLNKSKDRIYEAMTFFS